MPDPEVLTLLETGTRRLVRAVDALSEAEWAAPSLLPGWSRAHVVAHLALNAEALSAALEGVHEGRPVPMYPSQEARDAAVDELAAAPAPDVRERFLGSSTVLAESVRELADNLTGQLIERVPGSRTFPAGEVGLMRLREIEIHHADLGLDHTAADWPPAFVALLLTSRAAAHVGPPFTAAASDLPLTVAFGAVEQHGGPTVSGPASALAWWSTGRGSGEGLTSDDGELPRIEAW